MGRKKKDVNEAEALATEQVADQERAAPEPAAPVQAEDEPQAPKKRGRKPKGDLTLSDLAERYLAHMEEAGKSSGTIFSYRLELQTAMAELGSETKVADLTPERVMLYFGSDRVNKTRTGKSKSPLSIAKSQRVLRLALVWAQSAGLIEAAPLPEQATTH